MSVAQEAFSTVAGLTYGTVYRGVAYVSSGCDSEDHQDRWGIGAGWRSNAKHGLERQNVTVTVIKSE